MYRSNHTRSVHSTYYSCIILKTYIKGSPITPTHPSLGQQFRSFTVQNHIENLENAIEYFTVFGGLGWKVDTETPLMPLIEAVILANYELLHHEIIDISSGDSTAHALLTGIAMGDRRTHSAFKRARISEERGTPVIAQLCQSGIIAREAAHQETSSWIEENRVSDKLHFTTPFMRFWFAFISPLFKGIKAGNYDEFKERFTNRFGEFTDLIFVKLSMELLKKSFEHDPIIEIRSYWDKKVEIDILAKTASGKIIAGMCKTTRTKITKSELSKLREKCTLAGIKPDIMVLISKRGFSTELKALKGENLQLFSLKHFKKLLENLDEKEIMQGFPQPS